jgi:hypothetical protein
VAGEKINGSRKNYHHNDCDTDHNHHDCDDDMTQYTVDQLVDRTTGCSKIKLERRKQKVILLAKQGEQNGESKDSFINTQPQGG